MLLKRIAGSLSSELAAMIPELESANIRTTESLIFTPSTHILTSIPLLQQCQLDTLISHCLRLTAPTDRRGDDEEEEDDWEWAGFGIRALDEMFEGWDGRGTVEIAGPRKAGKSLLALHAALRILVRDRDAECRWVDTEGSFAPERARAILSSWGVEDGNEVLRRIVIIPAFKLEDVFEAISRTRESLEDCTSRCRVMVLDTIYTHFKDLLSATSAQGHAELVTLMEEVSEMTYEFGMVSFIINATTLSQPTNPLSSFNRMDIKPALGASFSFCTDVTLLVQETGKVFGLVDANERSRIRDAPGLRALVEVVRSRVSPTGAWTVFETDGTSLDNVIPFHEVDERTTRISAGLPVGPTRPAVGSLAQTLGPHPLCSRRKAEAASSDGGGGKKGKGKGD